MFLLDTDTCIAILRGNERVIRERRSRDEEVVTLEVTAAELYYGAAKSGSPTRNKQVVDRFLKTLRVVPLSRRGAQFFGIFKVELEAAGTPIPDADLWIGSMARALRATVVTGNTRHLGRIPGLPTEDWIRG